MLENGKNRYELDESETMIVWSQPPDILTWRAALNTVQPERLILFGQKPPIDNPKTLLTQIIGMAKYAYSNKAGIIYLSEMASYTAQSERTIIEAIRWINANSEMQLHREEDDLYYIRMGSEMTKAVDTKRLSLLMKETAAYRSHWMKQEF